MITKTFLKPFLLGMVSTLILIGTLAFTNPNLSPMGDGNSVSVSEANSQFNKYYSSVSKLKQKVKGAYIAKDQFSAMNTLLSANSSLAGFRVYGGVDSKGNQTAIVVGVDSRGADVTETIYSTAAANFGICPVVCDSYSPITSSNE